MPVGIHQTSAADTPDLIDRIGKLKAAILDMDGGVMVRAKTAVYISKAHQLSVIS